MTETRSVIIERELAYTPELIWQALTEPALIEDWLIASDFRPEVDHRFRFTADWGSVDCRVLEVEPQRSLTYTWQAHGVDTVVTWTLTPTEKGAKLRMEQAGFGADQKQAYGGAKHGWARFLDKLQDLLVKRCR